MKVTQCDLCGAIIKNYIRISVDEYPDQGTPRGLAQLAKFYDICLDHKNILIEQITKMERT